ncbi:MAG: TetR/AcrR family transcriptional regulator [Rhodobacterales bacterium]
MRVFWSEGYDGAAINRLSRDMRVPKASLYQEFGDKEDLFVAAIGRYVETRLSAIVQALEQSGTLEADLEQFFDAVATLATSDPTTPGCLIACALADAASNNLRLREELAARFAELETLLQARLEAEHTAFDDALNPRVAAILLASVARGLTLQARAGADRETLRQVGQAAVHLFVQSVNR